MLWMMIAAVVGGVLLLAGVPKVRDRGAMLRSVRGYRVLPAPLERLVAAVLPWAEIALGAALITGFAARPAAAAAALLFASFLAGLTINLMRGRRELDCGCFAFGHGGEAPRIGWFHALRAGALAVVSALLAVMPFERPTVGEHLTAIGSAVVVIAAVAASAQLRTIVHPGRRPVDKHLTKASIELRAASTVSRY
ncbi:methylamine utilization protein [Rhodococcus sp. ABRD24]|uniref:MauE/DoxX family redox-associated membrane protein n=1 Tax=Rhodococcus sp. ABRD24 TaxID=2507582 RepID=UPI00103C0A4D|nr:MauE/DoxX family redox-associated membrane protein [Rhodococcus sp. ABRD24]QBJ98646.1 methylamine utilization protein [Rhodococcus sp. ABRD24]